MKDQEFIVQWILKYNNVKRMYKSLIKSIISYDILILVVFFMTFAEGVKFYS